MPFVLLVGENGLGPWQAHEYAAQDQHVKLLESQVAVMTIRRRGKEYQRTGRAESGGPRRSGGKAPSRLQPSAVSLPAFQTRRAPADLSV
jgi:hypothetical protein